MPMQSNRDGGVAIIITLSILLVLSISLMKILESRTVEVAHLNNNINRFHAKSLARSLFRAILSSIRKQGLVVVKMGLERLPPQLPNILESGSFSNLVVRPIDHRFSLNRKFTQIADQDRARIFFNIIKNMRSESENYSLTEDDIYPVLSALNDWWDADDFPDDQYHDGIETYYQEELRFEIKDSMFDFLSEMKLIPRVRELKLSYRKLRSHFRVKGAVQMFIDINLASEQEISDFLQKYADLDSYLVVYENRLAIAEIAKQNMPSTLEPKYPLGVDPNSSSSVWRQELESLGIYAQMDSKEKKLFKTKSNHIEIDYTISSGNISLGLNSIVKLHYGGAKGDKVERFEILSYSYR